VALTTTKANEFCPLSAPRDTKGCLAGGCTFQLGEEFGQVRYLIMRVEAGGVGENPDSGLADRLGLEAELGFFAVEGDAVGGDADDGDEAGCVAEDFTGEELGAFAEFVGAELVGHGGGAGAHVGDA